MSSPLDIPPDLIGQSGLYNVPDPLLRRLRIEEPSGSPITDLDKHFKDKELLVLYAGSEYGEANLREFHRDLTTFAQKRHKSTAVIYVSTDVSSASVARITSQKPWLKMTFSDNSDFAPIGKPDPSYEAEVEDVARGEEFIQAGELEMGVEKVELGVEEYQNHYVRPLSRAGVTVLMSTFSTPSIALYHLPTHKFLFKNIKPSSFSPSNVDKNYSSWIKGGDPSLTISDVVQTMKWPLIALVLALIYHLAITFGGEEYNFIPGLINKIGWQTRDLVGLGLGAGRAL